MKAIKRTVAALLATLMLATSTSFTLAAENYSEKESVVVAKVGAAGIMTGTDKGFEPSKTLTRAEAAAIIVRMKGISESTVKTSAGTTLFNDVAASHWASGYINQASNLGIVKGVSAKEFAPEREVTVAEFTTMAVRALGAGTMVDAEGTWPINYVNFANEEGLLDEVPAIYTAVASRINAATIVANTLEAPMWVKTKATTNKEVTWEKSYKTVNGNDVARTILSETLNISVLEGYTLISYSELDKDVTVWNGLDNNEDTIIDADDYDDFEVADTFDMASVKLGVPYDIWYDVDEKEVVGMWKSEKSKLKSVEFTEIVKDSNASNITLMVDGKEVKYDFATSAQISYNNDTPVSFSKLYNDKALTFGSALLDGGKVKLLYAKEYTHAGIVSSVTSTRVKFDDADESVYASAVDFKLDDDDKEYYVTKDGKVIDASDLSEDDVVFYYIDKNETDIVRAEVATNTVEGKVGSVGSNYVKIDGKKYTLATGCTAPDAGDEIVAYLNAAEKIAMWDEVDEATGSFAVIKELRAVEDNKGTITAEVKLVYADGSVSDTLDLDMDETSKEISGGKDNHVATLKTLFGKLDKTTAGTYNVDITATDEVKTINDHYAFGNGSLLGKVVEFKIKNNKLVILSKPGAEADEAEVVDLTSTGAKFTAGRTASYSQYDITSSTKLLSVKADADYAYRVKVESINLDDMKTASSVEAFVADINKDRDAAKFVVLINGTYSIEKDGRYAVILSEESLDKDDDFLYSYEVAYIDGAVETYYSDTDFSDYLGDDSLNLIGKAVELTLNGKEITDVDYDTAAAYANGTEGFFYHVVSSKDTYLTKQDKGYVFFYDTNKTAVAELTADATANKYVLADEVLYVARDTADGSLSVGKESKISYLDLDDLYIDDNQGSHANVINATAAEAILKDADVCRLIVRNDNKGNGEVIAIIYAD